jgi:peptidoglycan/LPS O-acetylase OafA/YrhL
MSTTLTNSVSDKINAEGSSATARALRFESIDGLRGLACLMVLLCHSAGHFAPINWSIVHLGPVRLTQTHIFAYGYGGVDLFFVLSGFCLAYPIVSRPKRPVDWKQYAVNRARRILPPYWSALALFAVLSLLILHFHIEPFLSGHILAWQGVKQFAYSVSLISFSLDGSFWTLPIEWRWYFVLPVLIWLWRRIGSSGVLFCLVLISMISIFIFMPSHFDRLKFFVTPLFNYMPLFGLGIWAAALAARQENYRWEGQIRNFAPQGIVAALIVVIAFAPTHTASWVLGSMLLRLVTWGPLTFLLVLAATQDTIIRRLFSWRPLVWVGTFSYSLYLIHEPFLQIGAALMLPHHWPMFWNLACQIIILPALLIGLAYLFFLVAEKPFLRRPVKKAIEAEQFVLAAPTGIPGK